MSAILFVIVIRLLLGALRRWHSRTLGAVFAVVLPMAVLDRAPI